MTVEVAPLDAGHMYQAAMVRRVALWHALPHLRDVHTPEEDEAYWRTHLLAEYTVLGAFVDGGLAGVIAAGLSSSMFCPMSRAWGLAQGFSPWR